MGAHSPEAIRLLLTITTPDHIMYGSDFPYAAPQVLTAGLEKMKKYLGAERDLVSYRDMFLRENARALFDQQIKTNTKGKYPMNGNFTFHNPTRLHFGENAMESLKGELAAFGPTVMLTYGGGSIKKNGIYDQVVAALKAAGKTIVEDGGVMPNPTLEKLMDGVAKAKANNVDLILAVGGGSTIDYSKAVSVSTWCEEDPWEKYFVRFEEPSCRIIAVGSVLTMVGTGSEMNGGSVITNHAANLKVCKVFGPPVFRSSRSSIRASRLASPDARWCPASTTS